MRRTAIDSVAAQGLTISRRDCGKRTCMLLDRIDAGWRQASDRLALVSAYKCTCCERQPERGINAARFRCAHELTSNPTVFHARAHISLPDRPVRIINSWLLTSNRIAWR